ncbi:uncharacterized protein LOC135146195 [Zophobas morio]|uniref:uncharacterized protein LOC135146195 n=1 Tax=Zophobas morio TaxID=2755281 RepID=UPI0030827364
MGVKTPCISFHVGNTFNSYSQGSIIFCTASLIVSRLLLNDELESITMDNYMGNNREAWTVLKESLKTTRRQNRFVLSHELTHIAQEHSLFWTLYQPISLLAVHQLLKRKTLFFGSRPFLSLLSALLMSTCSSPFLFKYLESRADTAALFSKEMCLGGLTHIDRLLERNRAIRALVKANSAVDSDTCFGELFLTLKSGIRPSGEHLFSYSHPSYRKRKEKMLKLLDKYCGDG